MIRLAPLNYAYDALVPYIDAKTMEIHYTKHHQAYVDGLNKSLESYPEYQNIAIDLLLKDLVLLPADLKISVQNNGGGHYNHTLFWQMMSPKSGVVKGSLHQAIVSTFGSFDQFKVLFEGAAKTRFGSGWAWLILTPSNELQICSTQNQDNPITHGNIPLLGLDVWEHAYYLHYQNRRADYIAAWWHVVDWDFVQQRYEQFAK